MFPEEEMIVVFVLHSGCDDLMWNAGAPEVNQKIISLVWQMNLVLNLCPHTLAQGFYESVHETLLELTPSKCI